MKNNLVCFDSGPKAITDDTLPYIYVTSFDEESVKGFFKAFAKMDADPKCRVIPIVISSYGGQVYSLLAMLDIIETASKPVATIALGKAMSCGAILLSAGTKGHRYASASTDVMLHEVSSMEWGKATDISNNAAQTERLNSYIFGFLQKQSKQKDKKYFLNKLKSMGNIDWYLSSQECKNLGIVDHVSVPKLLTI